MPLGDDAPPVAQPPDPPKREAHYLWAALIARIYEVFPLLCPICCGQMRIIAFITHSADIRQIPDHIGQKSEPPYITPDRWPLRWEDGDAQAGEDSQIGADWAGRPNRHRTTRWSSASTGRRCRQRFRSRCGVLPQGRSGAKRLAIRRLLELQLHRLTASGVEKHVRYLASCD